MCRSVISNHLCFLRIFEQIISVTVQDEILIVWKSFYFYAKLIAKWENDKIKAEDVENMYIFNWKLLKIFDLFTKMHSS